MSYIPDIGDIIYINFDPQAGHEQSKRRPAVVLSPKLYNQKTSLLICVPLTTKIKGYPFEVTIKAECNSVALADHIKSLDWIARKAEYKSKVSQLELCTIQEKIALLLDL
ncbi:mRNA interferase MazF [Campylobacter hyointestinalis subsp. hyointestinalis]|uniref:mRNA interferase MazF n=1 Tax=Campylobacter hyointestinalis subsp. hyointestinalis TaxID=91352 RepID=A0A9W5AU84_CAMHY|nr:endoribonuclease MazF [Campylobacter hyointestinalis]CUU88667.1 mRNA interferase MazF [Campylobacter hyointestinalis subsp. hyointestinalis]CUU91391.1 mRNA interferase MazF [Campylobacter hyointestinalis subsp. hyointestinalis]CUU91482.1 mRNA interferase MazF [Campylobacter hyointestinalis subsp. hyointestinalis]